MKGLLIYKSNGTITPFVWFMQTRRGLTPKAFKRPDYKKETLFQAFPSPPVLLQTELKE
jgi:hypothetical protein